MIEQAHSIDFVGRLREVIAGTGLSHAKFAEHIGEDCFRLKNVLSENIRPSLDLLQKVLERCDVNANWLITGVWQGSERDTFLPITVTGSKKPRLKLFSSGHVELIAKGEVPHAPDQLKQIIINRYGSIKNFALTFGLDYQACIDALGGFGEKRAGLTQQACEFLGLPSNPTRIALSTARLKASSYGHSLRKSLSARASRRPEHPTSSGVATHSKGNA